MTPVILSHLLRISDVQYRYSTSLFRLSKWEETRHTRFLTDLPLHHNVLYKCEGVHYLKKGLPPLSKVNRPPIRTSSENQSGLRQWEPLQRMYDHVFRKYPSCTVCLWNKDWTNKQGLGGEHDPDPPHWLQSPV